MSDGLFHSRPSNPPPVDLDAIVREVLEFEDPVTHERNLTVPVTWSILDRDAPWPMLEVIGHCAAADLPYPVRWCVQLRIPCLRALPHEVRARVEQVCVAVEQLVAEKQRAGYTFGPMGAGELAAGTGAAPAPSASVSAVPSGQKPKRDRRRAAAHA